MSCTFDLLPLHQQKKIYDKILELAIVIMRLENPKVSYPKERPHRTKNKLKSEISVKYEIKSALQTWFFIIVHLSILCNYRIYFSFMPII